MAQLHVTLVLSLAVVALAWRAYAQGDFSLEDAFDDVPTQKPKPAPKPPKIPTNNKDDFDLTDFFDPTQPPRVIPKRPTKKPGVFIPTKKPFKPTAKPDFDDGDLEGIYDDGYKPDKGKGGGSGGRGAGGRGAGGNDNYDDSGNMAETGTIAGIASTLALALVGAVSSYISYQQKKFCFSIQQGLNAEYVKGENMEAVMAEEPQVKYSALEAQSAAPPTGDPSKV